MPEIFGIRFCLPATSSCCPLSITWSPAWACPGRPRPCWRPASASPSRAAASPLHLHVLGGEGLHQVNLQQIIILKIDNKHQEVVTFSASIMVTDLCWISSSSARRLLLSSADITQVFSFCADTRSEVLLCRCRKYSDPILFTCDVFLLHYFQLQSPLFILSFGKRSFKSE